jgi:hypothetical protein
LDLEYNTETEGVICSTSLSPCWRIPQVSGISWHCDAHGPGVFFLPISQRSVDPASDLPCRQRKNENRDGHSLPHAGEHLSTVCNYLLAMKYGRLFLDKIRQVSVRQPSVYGEGRSVFRSPRAYQHLYRPAANGNPVIHIPSRRACQDEFPGVLLCDRPRRPGMGHCARRGGLLYIASLIMQHHVPNLMTFNKLRSPLCCKSYDAMYSSAATKSRL